MSHDVLGFLPCNTPTKSRIFALIDRGDGEELEAVATVDYPHEAEAICNILNAGKGSEVFSGLWASLPDSVRASLEQARNDMVSEDDDRDLSGVFIRVLEDLEDQPDPQAAHPWTTMFSVSGCPTGGCEGCDGCIGKGADPEVNECRPGGACVCQTITTDDEFDELSDNCACGVMDITPRWAASLYRQLAEVDTIVEQAQDMMWGVQGPATCFPRSLVYQSPQFTMRLARASINLANDLAAGRPPIPQSIAEQIMLDGALEFAIPEDADELDGWLEYHGFKDLPVGHGDFEVDALWMFQIDQDSGFLKIIESEDVYLPGSMDHIFDELPQAAKHYPRPSEAVTPPVKEG